MELEELLTRFGAVVKNKKSFKCPFHNDNNASGGIYNSENGNERFKCLACGVNYNVFDLKKMLGINEVKEFNGELLTLQQIKNQKNVVSVNHFENLIGVTEAISVRFEEAGRKKWFKQYTPIGDKWICKGPKGPVFPYRTGNKASRVIIVEGEKTTDVFKNHPIENIDAMTSIGGANSAKKGNWSLLKGKDVVIWPDKNQAGLNYLEDLKNELKGIANSINWINPTELDIEEGQDAYDFLDKFGYDEYRKLALSKFPKSGYDDLIDDFQPIKEGMYRKLPNNFPILYRSTKFTQGGNITLIVGDAGGGKSWFVTQLIREWAEQRIKAKALFLEDDNKYYIRRGWAQYREDWRYSDLDQIEQNPEKFKKDAIEDSEFLKHFGTYLDARIEGASYKFAVDWIESHAKQGYEALFVDPVTMLEGSDKVWEDDKMFMREMNRIRSKYKTRLYFVTHPKKSNDLSMGNLAGGQSWIRFAQVILWLKSTGDEYGQHETENGTVESFSYNKQIIPMKGRNGKNAPSKINFLFNANTLTFKEIGIPL